MGRLLRLHNSYLYEDTVPHVVDEVNVFDFDDTLVKTKSHIYVTNKKDGTAVKLTPGQYAVYSAKSGDQFDFSDFEDVIEPEPIHHMLMKLKYSVRKLGEENVFILTARGSSGPIRRFLDAEGVGGIRIIALGSGDPQAKAEVIRKEIESRGVKIIKFYDDSPKNVAAVKNLRNELPGVQVLSFKV
jgi:hypothetical protein